MNFDILDRMRPMPEREAAGDHQPNQHADEKEQPIAGKKDEEDGNDGSGDKKSSRTLRSKAETGPGHTC